MVQYMWSENNKFDTWQWQEPETTALSAEKRPIKFAEIEDDLPLQKRWKLSSSQTTNKLSFDSSEIPVIPSEYNPLIESSPLGLQLKKSQSLLDLIQERLSQSNKRDSSLPRENLQVGNKKNIKARVVGTSGPIDKLKASNFPASVLKIGQWEYKSQHEGDLVAKCYFAKHKIVWEVLDGGLKNKIEIQWADIVGLKANCPDNGPGTLTILLGKPPLFFKETNPQPRKHTLWQATSDFTNGEASKYRQHYLECAQGVLNKHYEKLIHCDTRLNFLSQQLDTVSDLPFASEASIKAPNALQTNVFNRPENSNGSLGSNIQRTKANSDVMNHIGHKISEKRPMEIKPLFTIVDDTHLTTGSDELTRVNSLNPMVENEMKHSQELLRKDSNADVLNRLQRFGPFPSFLFDFNEDAMILRTLEESDLNV